MFRQIIEVLGHRFERDHYTLEFWMPYTPTTLAMLLSTPTFSPSPHEIFDKCVRDTAATSFLPVTRGLVLQLLFGVSYLHDPLRRIAHRDLKPSNILIDAHGTLKLIDFGIAYRELDTNKERSRDIWPEGKTDMYFEVGSG
jgi:serine/threonine protein kinase